MTGDETVKVLRFLASAWPSFTLPPETAVLWAGLCQKVAYAEAMEAATSLQRTEDWFPNLSRFHQTVSALRRRDAMEVNTTERKALTEAPWPESGKTAKEWVADIREKLANAHPYRIDPKTGERVILPYVPGFRQVAQNFGLPSEGDVA